jgi:hypothetical protein
MIRIPAAIFGRFDRRMPGDARVRAEAEYERREDARPGEVVIRSEKFIDIAKAEPSVERDHKSGGK